MKLIIFFTLLSLFPSSSQAVPSALFPDTMRQIFTPVWQNG